MFKHKNIMKWYALYTKSRHEKTAQKMLAEKGMNVFLPLIEEVKIEKYRRRTVEVPLFKSYIFAEFDYRYRFDILKINGIVKIVNFNGEPAVVPEWQIESLRKMLKFPETLQLERFIKPGEIVEIKDGPMQGLKGIVSQRKNEHRLVISIEGIMQSVSIEIDQSLVRKTERPKAQRLKRSEVIDD